MSSLKQKRSTARRHAGTDIVLEAFRCVYAVIRQNTGSGTTLRQPPQSQFGHPSDRPLVKPASRLPAIRAPSTQRRKPGPPWRMIVELGEGPRHGRDWPRREASRRPGQYLLRQFRGIGRARIELTFFVSVNEAKAQAIDTWFIKKNMEKAAGYPKSGHHSGCLAVRRMLGRFVVEFRGAVLAFRFIATQAMEGFVLSVGGKGSSSAFANVYFQCRGVATEWVRDFPLHAISWSRGDGRPGHRGWHYTTGKKHHPRTKQFPQAWPMPAFAS